jgi:N-acetylglucosamine-6-phosphate deacetylase
MSEYIAYVNGIVHDGTSTLHEHAVICKNGLVEELMAIQNLPADIAQIDLHGNHLAQSFIDLQIYGANKQLFSSHSTVESLQATADYCANGGANHFMITLATNSWSVVQKGIETVQAYWQAGRKGLLGLHLEGPFINPIKRGAHLLEHIETPTIEKIEDLLAQANGAVKMMTLAPETCSDEVIELLLKNDIVLSAGHSNATYTEAIHAFDNGFSTVTHLYNAMSGLHHREPGLVGAALNHTSVMSSIVADGHHVDWPAIQIAKQLMKERLFLITDAVTENGVGAYPHQLNVDHYQLPDGTLSGSALTMLQAVKNMVQNCKVDLDEALRMASLYPAQVMNFTQKHGQITKGCTASFVVFDNDLNMIKTYQ